ncbi:hypothetical protein BD324DRAFT_616222 [Kockovaella imperatae]|uniref:Uncharacterized protein n=1 Tax=Kockovaella imperatae TaxID=4999 RepID=A0A1Y1UQ07_9TREE|nr:hypothetical protein BD324DRAFT_616222 [Kockovaella imperatae]ORX40089.1 hypothetical protein BD324DRAFT_616222 [Kockovaella imperatae]
MSGHPPLPNWLYNEANLVTHQPRARDPMRPSVEATDSSCSTRSSRSFQTIRFMFDPLRLRGGCSVNGSCDCLEDPVEKDRKKMQIHTQPPHWRQSDLGTRSIELDTRSRRTSFSVPQHRIDHITDPLSRAQTHQTDRSVNLGLRQALKDDPAFGTIDATGFPPGSTSPATGRASPV